jgi:acyl carrier protein
MPEKEIITAQLEKIFREVFNEETTLTHEMTANDIGAWDSLSHMLMITEVEKFFAINFKLREINKLKNVGALIELIQSKVA